MSGGSWAQSPVWPSFLFNRNFIQSRIVKSIRLGSFEFNELTATSSAIIWRGLSWSLGSFFTGRTLSVSRKRFRMRHCWRGLTSVSNLISSGENWHVSILTTVQHIDSAIKTPLGIVSACRRYVLHDGWEQKWPCLSLLWHCSSITTSPGCIGYCEVNIWSGTIKIYMHPRAIVTIKLQVADFKTVENCARGSWKVTKMLFAGTGFFKAV